MPYEQLHSYKERHIWVDREKHRMYVYVTGAMDKEEFLKGQAVMDFALDALLADDPEYIDFIYDTSTAKPINPILMPTFIKRGLAMIQKAPQLHVWAVTTGKSMMWMQLTSMIPYVKKHLKGIFTDPDEVERMLDKIRGFDALSDSQEIDLKALQEAIRDLYDTSESDPQ